MQYLQAETHIWVQDLKMDSLQEPRSQSASLPRGSNAIQEALRRRVRDGQTFGCSTKRLTNNLVQGLDTDRQTAGSMTDRSWVLGLDTDRQLGAGLTDPGCWA